MGSFKVDWHKSGQMKSAVEYKSGKPNGLFTSWYENGQRSTEINYRDGHRHGLCTLWHKDGLKRSEVVYSNGKMNGLWVLWHKTGQIRQAILFKELRKSSKASWYDNGGIRVSAEYGPRREYQNFSNINIYKPDFDCPILGNDSRINAKQYWAIEYSWWNRNGQKKGEQRYCGYDHSAKNWHDNGQKSMEEKGGPVVSWNEHGVKECELSFNFDLNEVDMQSTGKFFDRNGQYIMTVIETECFDEFTEWKFLDKNNNKVYEYKHNYLKDTLITSDELWDIWLNSGSKEFVTMLKSSKSHQSVFCRLSS